MESNNDDNIYDNYIDPEVFLLIGRSLHANFKNTNSEEDLLKLNEFLKVKEAKEAKESKKIREKAKEKEEDKIAIQILQQKIREYEENQKPKSTGFFSNLFTKKKDLFNEMLERERYIFNKTLLDQLLKKVGQINF
jgi:NDP-sugar pyrophosphorylase family protein